MKVILLRDVARIGKKGSIAEVPDGYAMNQLIPSKSAEPATPQNLKKVERTLKDKAAKVEADQTAFAAAVSSIDALSDIVLTAPANEKEHLFKAIASADVVQALKELDVDISAFLVSFKEPVKTVGEHSVLLSHAGQTHTFTINVKAV